MGEIWAGKALMSVHNIVKSERAIQEEKKQIEIYTNAKRTFRCFLKCRLNTFLFFSRPCDEKNKAMIEQQIKKTRKCS